MSGHTRRDRKKEVLKTSGVLQRDPKEWFGETLVRDLRKIAATVIFSIAMYGWWRFTNWSFGQIGFGILLALPVMFFIAYLIDRKEKHRRPER
jgi:fatty acid desaturase